MAADENLPDDAPEADALEQRREAFDSAGDDPEVSVGSRPAVDEDSFEVPEADAYEQAQEVPDDGDDVA